MWHTSPTYRQTLHLWLSPGRQGAGSEVRRSPCLTQSFKLPVWLSLLASRNCRLPVYLPLLASRNCHPATHRRFFHAAKRGEVKFDINIPPRFTSVYQESRGQFAISLVFCGAGHQIKAATTCPCARDPPPLHMAFLPPRRVNLDLT